jgi:hypothetical protein
MTIFLSVAMERCVKIIEARSMGYDLVREARDRL